MPPVGRCRAFIAEERETMSEEQTGNEVTGDADQGQDVSTVDEKKDEGIKTVPITSYQAEKEKRQEAEAQVELLQQQAAIAAANRAQPVQSRPTSAHDQAIKDCGLQDVQWLDAAQQSQVEARKEQILRSQTVQEMMFSAGRAFIDSKPDYGDVVGTQQGTVFIPSKTLKELLKEEPEELAALTAGPAAAYKIVQKYIKRKEREKELDALKEHTQAQSLDDSLKPMSPGTKGGGSSTKRSYKTADDVRRVELEIEQGLYG